MNNFDKRYFERYKRKNLFGLEKGERPFLYSFWIRKLKKFVPKGAKILEVGCGAGYFLKWLEKEYNVAGIDISVDALEIAKRNLKQASLYLGSAEDLPFENNSFSVVIAFDLIEHLKKPSKFFAEAYRVLLPRGFLLISTPNPESFGSKVKGRKIEFKNLPYEKRIYEWYGWRDDTHINIKSKRDWREIMQKVGFKILKDEQILYGMYLILKEFL
jgi:ubiquinone/menaquinone biosynthesis C-methylase UbiE